jgi:branched-chain amino acid transport system substrate-binding protein
MNHGLLYSSNMKILFSLLCIASISVSAHANDKLKIGFVGPRTGSAASTGAAFQEGIELALDELKAKGGDYANVSVFAEDTSGVPEKAAAAFEKLATKEKVSIVLGESHSSCALAEIELAERYQVPFVVIEAWADAIMEKGYSMVFREGPSNSAVVNSTISKFVIDQKFKKVVMVAENSDWGKGISGLTEKALKTQFPNLKIIMVDNKAKDFYNELNQVKAEKPDLVIAFIYSFALHTFVSQAHEVGVTPAAKILDGAGTPSLWPEFWSNVKDAGEGELFLSSMHESVHPTKKSKEYWNAYTKKFGKAPSDYKSRSSYTAVLLAAEVLVKSLKKNPNFSGKDVVSALEKIEFQAPTGLIKFGSKAGVAGYHQWNPPMLIGQWQNRKQVVVYPKKLSTGKFK